MAWGQADRDATSELSTQGRLATDRFSESLELAIAQVRSLQAFFEASNEVSAVEFSRFSLHQGRSPGIEVVGYAPVIPTEEFGDFAREAITERSNYVTLDMGRRPVTDPDHPPVPVWYGHQYRLMPPVLGLDLADDPVRSDTIAKALSTNRLAITPFVDVLGQTKGPFIEIYAPVREKINGRRGVVFATVVVNDLIPATMLPEMAGTEVEVTDVTESAPELPEPLPRNWSGLVLSNGRSWRVDLRRSEPLVDQSFALLALVSGLAMSLMASAATFSLGSSRERKRKLADLMAATEEKDAFLASVAHELRTPLTSVVAVTALLSEEPERLDPDETAELAAIAHREATDLADLIEDILVAGRLDAGAINYKPETLNLSQELGLVLGREKNGPKVEFHLPTNGIAIHADPLRVRQIIRNIVLGSIRNAHARVHISAIKEGNEVRLQVRNDGPPISPANTTALLNPSHASGFASRPGTMGRGIPVSRRLAEAMGGSMSYDYSEGWCSFVVRLPLSADHEPVIELTEEASALAPQTSTQTRSPSSTL